MGLSLALQVVDQEVLDKHKFWPDGAGADEKLVLPGYSSFWGGQKCRPAGDATDSQEITNQ